jgi:hypothetical protein
LDVDDSVCVQVGGWWTRGGNRRDRLLDPGGELVDLAAEGVDLV